jgi:hypothetical protein
MAPRTPPQSPYKRREASTRSKSRFFDAYDTRPPGHCLQDVIYTLHQQFHTFTFQKRACQYWLHIRQAVGRDKSIRRLGRRHQKPSRITDIYLDTLLHASTEIRSQPLDVQILFHQLPGKRRNLSKQLYKRRKARRFKKAWVRAVLRINQVKRAIHCKQYRDESVEFWYNKHFSDEAHIDPFQSSAEYILREEGTRLNPENMQMEHFSNYSQRLHIAATISWHHKGELHFYNDEPPVIRPRKPRRHRASGETDAEYHQKILEWSASLPRKKGGNNNSMT